MKPNHLKEQFAQREIQPSADAWEKLNGKLDQAQSRKRVSSVMYWMGSIAAGFILLIAGYLSLQSDESMIVNPSSSIAVQEDNSQNQVEESTQIENKIQETIIVDHPTDIGKTEKKENPSTKVIQQSAIATKVTQTPKSAEQSLIQDSPVIEESEALIADIPEANIPEKVITQPKNSEIDDLLNSAMAELEAEKNVQVEYSLSADQLLREAEWDVEYEKRNRLQKSLNKSLESAAQDALAFIGLVKE